MNDAESIANRIVQVLFSHGYLAYYAGGWVRDLLRGEKSDEIDIATSAPPEKIMELFSKTVPVGISFGVIIVVEEGKHFEVTTFRKDHPYHDGRHPDGIDFSTPQKDALRRDFTINGMFYDPLTKTIHDFVGGQEDLKKHLIRAIGNPHERFAEDRLRMLRAVRFAARLGFKIEKETEEAILHHAPTLFPSVSMERVWQEFNKMAFYPRFDWALVSLHRLGLLSEIFSSLKSLSLEEIQQRVHPFPYFPLHCPPILYLLELFPQTSLAFRIDLCHYLKATHHDVKLVTFFTHTDEKLSGSLDRTDWAHFYANPLSSLYLQVKSAHFPHPKRGEFLMEHQKRAHALSSYIDRIVEHRPLVSSSMLRKEGIPPSKKMGELLREAERLAINDHLTHSHEVLERLKRSPLWPT